MSITHTRIAAVLIGWAKAIAPSDRKEWFDGMAAECDHMPSQGLVVFAFGCLTTSVRLRAATPEFVLAAARSSLVLGAIVWSLAHIWLAARVWPADTPLLVMASLMTAAIFAAGAGMTAWRGLGAVSLLALPATVAGGTAMLSLWALPFPAESTAIYRALLIEDVFMLLVAIIVANAAQSYAASKRKGAQ